VITVSRLDGSEVVVNAELIELVEATPDTHLTLTDGKRLIVRETPDEVVARVIAYRQEAYGPRRVMHLVASGQ
jgi:flagellar protein FlbD